MTEGSALLPQTTAVNKSFSAAAAADKTGTLTENRMTVISGWVAGQFYESLEEGVDLPKAVLPHLELNAAVNSQGIAQPHKGLATPVNLCC